MISDELKKKALDFLSEVENLAKDDGYQVAKNDFDSQYAMLKDEYETKIKKAYDLGVAEGETAAKRLFDDLISQMKADYDKRIVEERETYYNEGFKDGQASESTVAPTEVMNYTDGMPYENDKVKMVAIFSYARKYTTTKWCTIVLPISLNYSDWSSKFEIAEITGVSVGTNITPTRSVLGVGSQTLPNHPYLIRIKKSSSSTQVISKKNCAVYPSTPGSVEIVKDGKKYTFKGTYARIEADDLVGKYYSNGGVFVNAVKSCNPMRVYLEIS